MQISYTNYMTTARAEQPVTGHRARKRQATRDAIENTALDLFAHQGYDETTLAQIAEAAGVSPRTIFSYFESKEDIVFADEPFVHQRLKDALLQRSAGETTVQALRAFLTSEDAADARARLRGRIIAASESLRGRDRARSAPLERILAASIARDLDVGSDDVRPAIIAASMTSTFGVVRNRLLRGRGRPLSHAETLRVLDLALTFIAGGLEALRNEPQK